MRAAAAEFQDTEPQAVSPRDPIIRHFMPPPGLREALLAPALKLGLRMTFKAFMRPPFPLFVQRGLLHGLSLTMPQVAGVSVRHVSIGGIPAERLAVKGLKPRRAVLYMHGGGFCTGSPRSHRTITTRLAQMTQAEVLVPHYRRIPEHPFPAQVEDGVAAYRQLLQDGYQPEHIAIAGDSAGASLTLMVPLALRQAGLPLPGVLVMMSPAIDLEMKSRSAQERRGQDPMINTSWGKLIVEWLKVPHGHPLVNPTAEVLSGWPPIMIQVGEHEVLFDDAHHVAGLAAQAGNHVELEVYAKRWHVFQAQAGLLHGSTAALRRQADFMLRHWGR
ncbi:MAG: alpha/beta hydrolase [Burkholderiales bacterium]|nr:alpha/beta hydrolase [Burkholderiales bacterium]